MFEDRIFFGRLVGHRVGGFDEQMTAAANLQVRLFTAIITLHVPIVWVVITHAVDIIAQVGIKLMTTSGESLSKF